MRVVRIAVKATALVLLASVATAASYDQLCDEMVSLAKLAAQAHNRGDEVQSKKFMAKVRSTYESAAALDRDHPQAHLNYATFLMNTNQFDEATTLFKRALAGLGDNMQARGQVMANMRRCEYGHASMKRDEAYDHGKGDLYEAALWGEKQLPMSPEPHRTNHDIATMQAMLCEYDTKACETAGTKFRASATATMQHYTTFKAHQLQGDQRAFLQCSNGRLYTGSWSGHRLVETKTVWQPQPGAPNALAKAGKVQVHTFNAAVQLVGRDGLVTIDERGDCSVFSPAADDYPNLPDNLMPKTAALAAQPSAPVHTVPVVSLVQFAASTFYHWLGEVVPRLVIAKNRFAALARQSQSGKLRFLVPRLSDKNKFVAASFDLLLGSGGDFELSEYVPGSKVQTQLSYVAWDRQPCPPAVRDSEAVQLPNSPRVCHALAHPHALNKARDAIRAAIGRGSWGKVRTRIGSRLVVFASRGKGVSMREIDDTFLIDRLRTMLAQEATVIGPTEFEVFDNSQSFEEALALFSRADVVVGVHGGALTNIIASPAGATLVEIGFIADAAQHYQHMSLSLGLNYRRVRVLQDSQGRALGAPTVRYSTDGVLDAVRHSLGCWMSGRELPPPAVTVAPLVDEASWLATAAPRASGDDAEGDEL